MRTTELNARPSRVMPFFSTSLDSDLKNVQWKETMFRLSSRRTTSTLL